MKLSENVLLRILPCNTPNIFTIVLTIRAIIMCLGTSYKKNDHNVESGYKIVALLAKAGTISALNCIYESKLM